MKNYTPVIFLFLLALLSACHTVKRGLSEDPVEPDTGPKGVFSEVLPAAPEDTVKEAYPEGMSAGTFSEKVMYEQAFEELKRMLQGIKAPDFERAVFISENPYYATNYLYEDFQANIDFHEYMIRQLMQANNKSDSMDFDVAVNQYGRFNIDAIRFLPEERKELYRQALANWAIFAYITDTIAVYPYDHFPYTYATHDPFGIKDWQNSQVLHLLSSEDQKGNCFALTAFFKILSNRLKSDARICTAPQHIYIQHRDPKGDYYNVELATAGHPGDGTIQTLTYTTTEAIKNGIALRSYDERQSIGLCLVNLAKSYEHRFGVKDADFILQCAELVLQYDTKNLSALLLKQQVLDERLRKEVLQLKSTDPAVLRVQPEAGQAITGLEQHLSLLYELGYRQMPYDMQEVIMTGKLPETYEDKNESPFTTIDPKDEHRKSFKTLYGGLFREVFEKKELETYGSITFNTVNKRITAIDTEIAEGFLIDPVAFAYDFGARMYDARLGRWLSIDAMAGKYPSLNPYNFVGNSPIKFIDFDGNDFGIDIDHSQKTIIITANFYTINKAYKKEIDKAIAKWNKLDGSKIMIGGQEFTVSMKLQEAIIAEGSNDIERFSNAHNQSDKDPIGNTYNGSLNGFKGEEDYGNRYLTKRSVFEKEKEVGISDGKNITMPLYNMGDYLYYGPRDKENSVEHEIGHNFGLDDPDGKYYSPRGVMDYDGPYAPDIKDLENLIKYSVDFDGQGSPNVKMNQSEKAGSGDYRRLKSSDVGK